MKIVQAFFTKNKDLSSLNGGWINTKYHLLGWALSASLLKKNNDRLELVTDVFGKQILVEELGLPFSKVSTDLENFDIDPAFNEIWLIKKIFTHTLHNEPFIFVDGDAFVYNVFEPRLLKAGLVAQNKSPKSIKLYTRAMHQVLEHFDYIPEYWTKNFEKVASLSGCCTGIVGGNDHQFFKDYYQEVLHILKCNKSKLSKLNPIRAFNITLEESTYYHFAKYKGKAIEYLCDFGSHGHYPGLADFHLRPEKRSFFHLIGGNKLDKNICFQMERRLAEDFPLVYNRLIQFIKKHKLDDLRSNYEDFWHIKKQHIKPKKPRKATTQNFEPKTDPAIRNAWMKYRAQVDTFYEDIKTEEEEVFEKFARQQVRYCDFVFGKEENLNTWKVKQTRFGQVLKTPLEKQYFNTNVENICIDYRKKLEFYREREPQNTVLISWNPPMKWLQENILLSEKVIFTWLEESESLLLSELMNKIRDYCRSNYKFYLEKVLINKLRSFIYRGIIQLEKVE